MNDELKMFRDQDLAQFCELEHNKGSLGVVARGLRHYKTAIKVGEALDDWEDYIKGELLKIRRVGPGTVERLRRRLDMAVFSYEEPTDKPAKESAQKAQEPVRILQGMRRSGPCIIELAESASQIILSVKDDSNSTEDLPVHLTLRLNKKDIKSW